MFKYIIESASEITMTKVPDSPTPPVTTSIVGLHGFPDPIINGLKDIQSGEFNQIRMCWGKMQPDGTLLNRDNPIRDGQYLYFSPENLAQIKGANRQVFYTVGSDHASAVKLLSSKENINSFTTLLISFCRQFGFAGIDIDFEELSQYTDAEIEMFKYLLTALKANFGFYGLKVSVCVPALDANTQSWYKLKYMSLTMVDNVFLMIYDNMYDTTGAGAPLAPVEWIKGVCEYAKSQLPVGMLIAGLPAYGYSRNTNNTGKYTNMTYDQLSKITGFSTAKRDASSAELMWKNAGKSYVLSDNDAMKVKLDIVKASGVQNYSLWHAGARKQN